MTAYLSAVWKCRYFWLALVQMDLRSRYRRSVLGMAWSLLHPLCMTAVLCTVFHKLFGLDIREYGPSLLVGISFWNFITTCTNQGCKCLFEGEKYIRQYPAPIAIYPIRTVLSASFHFVLAFSVVLLLRFVFHGFDGLLSLLSLIPTLLLLVILGWSLAVLAGFATAYFPDMLHLSEVGLQMVFYATPIIYPPEILRARGLGLLIDLNPLASFVQLLRLPIMSGQMPSVAMFTTAAMSTAIIAGAAVLTLVRLQRKIIFQL